MQSSEVLKESAYNKQKEAFEKFYAGETKEMKLVSGKTVGRSFSLDSEIRAVSPVYSTSDRRLILTEMKTILRDFYVHLEIKKAQYGFDPVRALERLEPVAETLSDADFHQSLTQLIAKIRDRHVVFKGRAPIGANAVLPFLIERCWIKDVESYVVTKLQPQYAFEHLTTGAVVKSWNGIPIDRYVNLNANITDGGNEAASIARSVAFLTQRPLTRFAAPFETFVLLGFEVNGQFFEERFKWSGLDVSSVTSVPAIGRNVVGFGGDVDLLQLQQVNRVQFVPQSFVKELVDPSAPAPVPTDGTPVLLGQSQHGNFDYGTITTGAGNFGYIRLYHFASNGVDDIANDVISILDQMPNKGLIFDIRGNTGGYIAAGERVLQLFTARLITPARFQFRVNASTIQLIAGLSEFQAWQNAVRRARQTGELYTQGFPIEGTDDDANQFGQRYFGPVVVVTDALAFSTADIFAAGFIDHEIGKIICIDKNMAAAGGNNWQANIARALAPDLILDATFRADIEAGTLSDGLRNEFNQRGVSLGPTAQVVSVPDDLDERRWNITDGTLTHTIRCLSWLGQELLVYFHFSRLGLNEIPNDISFGFTARRAIRSGKNEGSLLEDLGIEPDLVYKPTLKDVLNQNQDLLLEASNMLATMPAYDMKVSMIARGDKVAFTLSVENIDEVQIFSGEKHQSTHAVDAGGTVTFEIEKFSTTIIKGFKGVQLVARRFIKSPQ